MKPNEIVKELQVVKSEYVIAAYVRGRYEIQVCENLTDALTAIELYRRNSIYIGEIRLEISARWGSYSHSSYRRIGSVEVPRLMIIEPALKAGVPMRLAQNFASRDERNFATT